MDYQIFSSEIQRQVPQANNKTQIQKNSKKKPALGNHQGCYPRRGKH